MEEGRKCYTLYLERESVTILEGRDMHITEYFMYIDKRKSETHY